MRQVLVQAGDFDPGALLSALGGSGAGAVSSFVGHVRGDDGLRQLILEHYPEMTEAALAALADEALERWPLFAVTIIHRFGPLVPGDRIVFAGAASSHRAAAIAATNFLIDNLKTRAPFWKREVFADGRENWVEAKEDDDKAEARWHAS